MARRALAALCIFRLIYFNPKNIDWLSWIFSYVKYLLSLGKEGTGSIVHILTSAVHQRPQFSAALPLQPTDVKCYYAKKNCRKWKDTEKNSFKMVTIEAYFIHLYLKWNDNKSDDNNNNVFQKCNCFTQVPSLSLLHIFLSKLREEDTVSFTIMCWKRGVSKVSILMIFSCPANASSIRTCPCWLTDWEKNNFGHF